MKHKFDDGRELMASYEDISTFFRDHPIVGRTIRDIRSAENDYMIRNLEDFSIEELNGWTTESAIETDGQIAILFEDGDHMEIEYAGDGPVLLGFNTADFNKYPVYNGNCYTLQTLFRHCIGRQITAVHFEKSSHRMEFPAFCGIDMSSDDEGIREIRLELDDGTYLAFFGIYDFFDFVHRNQDGEELRVPYSDLLQELNAETLDRLFGSQDKD